MNSGTGSGRRSIAVVTVGRSDYGIYKPILNRIASNDRLELRIVAGGMHLVRDFGYTLEAIESDGFEVDARIEMLLAADTSEGMSKSIGLGVIGFSQYLQRRRPDILLVLGDRFEMLAAVVAALPFRIPVAHIHGGELTEGALDDSIRHSITKMSHLHFVSTEQYEHRLQQLGEEPWRICVSGAPAIDNMIDAPLLSRELLAERYQLDISEPFLLATYHPVTTDFENTEAQMDELLAAIRSAGRRIVFTYPNADMGNRSIIRMLHEYVAESGGSASIVRNLGTEAYFSLMANAEALVGNSSSGIIEAASFKLPVVNIGPRQRGRTRSANVIDVDCERDQILKGIDLALSEDFRRLAANVTNLYGNGHAADKIVNRLQCVDLGQELLIKRFCDFSQLTPGATGVTDHA